MTKVECASCGEAAEIQGGDEQAWVETVIAQHAETGCTGELVVLPNEA